MHIAVSAEARKRANREFRAIVLRIPSFAPLCRTRVSSPYLVAISSFRSSRFQFRPDPAWIYLSHIHAASLPFFSRHSSQPCSAFTFPACSLFSSFPHARRQLRDATNCSRVYRHIIITRKSAGSIIARDLIRFEFKCTLLRFDLHDSFFSLFGFLLFIGW